MKFNNQKKHSILLTCRWYMLGLKIWINDHFFRIKGDYGPKKRK